MPSCNGRLSVFIAAIATTTLLTACMSDYYRVAPRPPARYTKLGPAEGTACGSMLLLWVSTSFIPVGLNDRTERAYRNAVESVPGAKALVNVNMEHSWYWWVIGTFHCVTVKGEAIK